MIRIGRYPVVFAIVLLLVLLSWLTVFAGVPTIVSPLNLFIVIPWMLASEWLDLGALILAILLVPLVFCLWCFPAWNHRPEIPLRSWVLFAVVSVLSAVYSIVSYQYGFDYQGKTHTIAVISISFGWLAAIIYFGVASRRNPMFGKNLAFHAALFSWLAWYAFPWMGELP